MQRFRVLPAAIVLIMIGSMMIMSGDRAAADPSPDDPTGTYTNPVSAGFTRNFADPTVIRGHDGYWYAYATNGRRDTSDSRQLMMISRSDDLVDWEWVGPVFTAETMPRYDGYPADANRQFWAPEIAYLDGRYVLYYSYVINQGAGEVWSVTGAATADHPAGPWVDTGHVVVGNEYWSPRPGRTALRNNIDPELVTAPDGTRYLYYGSVLGGVRVVELSADGLSAVGEPVQLTMEHRYEASYVVHRDGHYYLFLSLIGGCCAGVASGYPVVVGRSKLPTGPFVDRAGHPLAGEHAGGTPVLMPNGNAFVGTGHNAIATDLSGQDWILSHAFDRNLVAGELNARQLALTRLDWIDGWPVARAGLGIPEGPEPAPDNRALVADAFESGGLERWETADGWRIESGPTGPFVRSTTERPLVSPTQVSGELRVRGAVRMAPGRHGRVGIGAPISARNGLTVWIDRSSRKLIIESSRGDRTHRAEDALPESFRYDTWHEIQMIIDHRGVRAAVSESGQYDPVAEAELIMPHTGPAGSVALQAEGTPADFDDVTAARLYEPVTRRQPDPPVGVLDRTHSDDFNTSDPDGDLDPSWRWVRTAAASVDHGQLAFEMQSSSLRDNRPGPDLASVLTRTMPDGGWTAETKVTVPFGSSLPYGQPSAGLIAYNDDDSWVDLVYTARIKPRFVAFSKETPAPNGGPAYGHAALGPSRDTMWLRLRHTVAPDGEHHYRAATSVDGRHWVWHGTRVLPAGDQPRVGLVAMDLDDHPEQPPLTARFDWFRVYR